MARARNIKPGFFANEELAECEPLARLMFAGLWCLADREGRLEDRPKRIRVALLPYDACDPDALLNQLQAHGFIERYVVDGQGLIQVNGFTKHQMPHHKEVASTLPPVPGSPAITRHGYDVSKDLRAAVFERDGNECLKCGTKEALTIDHIVPLSKGGDNEASNLQTLCHRCNSSKGDATKSYRSDAVETETRRSNYRQGSTLGQRNSNDDASCPTDSLIPDSLIPDSNTPQPPEGEREVVPEDLFASFWKLYPRKTDKAKAQKAWTKLNPDRPLFEKIMRGLGNHCVSRDWIKDDGQFIPHPTTWLNGKRWEDEVRPAGTIHQFPGQSRHTDFDKRDYTAGLTQREDGTYAF